MSAGNKANVRRDRNGREFVSAMWRLPPNLHAQIKSAAAESSRSMNAEIMLRLQKSFAGTPASDSTDVQNTLHELGQIPLYSIADDVAAIRQLLEQLVARGAA